ncbi:hypothetical protein NQZ68_014404 [Dissostichus eleginoides]|nr:hypothetical protein NQZ68_014404 [Dissostichus eleginoides]
MREKEYERAKDGREKESLRGVTRLSLEHTEIDLKRTVGKALLAFNWEIPSTGLEEGEACGNYFGENPPSKGGGVVLTVYSTVCGTQKKARAPETNVAAYPLGCHGDGEMGKALVAHYEGLVEAVINGEHHPSAVQLIFKGLLKQRDFRGSLAEHYLGSRPRIAEFLREHPKAWKEMVMENQSDTEETLRNGEASQEPEKRK